MVIFIFSFGIPTAKAIEYFGGKITKLKILDKKPAPGVPKTQLQIRSEKISGDQITKKKETVYIAGGVVGNCRPGRYLLGSGKTIRGRKVMTFGICK